MPRALNCHVQQPDITERNNFISQQSIKKLKRAGVVQIKITLGEQLSLTALREARDWRNKENITSGLTSVGGGYGGPRKQLLRHRRCLKWVNMGVMVQHRRRNPSSERSAMMDASLMLNFYERSNREGVKHSIIRVVSIPQKLLCCLCCSRNNDETLINRAVHICNPNSMKNILAPPVKQFVSCFSCC